MTPTPQTTPAHFNEVFALFQRSGEVKPGSLGMCLDIGHANLPVLASHEPCAQVKGS